MTVLDYFRQHFPTLMLFEHDDILAEMPVDSACGLDCKCAIDAAVGLINQVRKAYGEPHTGHPKSATFHEDILNATVQVCVCYIRG